MKTHKVTYNGVYHDPDVSYQDHAAVQMFYTSKQVMVGDVIDAGIMQFKVIVAVPSGPITIGKCERIET